MGGGFYCVFGSFDGVVEAFEFGAGAGDVAGEGDDAAEADCGDDAAEESDCLVDEVDEFSGAYCVDRDCADTEGGEQSAAADMGRRK